MNVQGIREIFIRKYKNKEFVSPRGERTVEIINANFLADEPSIFGKPNQDYIERELEWYLSQSLNVNDIPGKVPEIWLKCCDRNGFINSNYGYLVFNPGNDYQYVHTIDTLKKDPFSRRAIMIYTRPSMHYDWEFRGRSDFICTNTVQYLIRDDKLLCIVGMRSNDSIYGYANDYAWQKFIQNKMANELDITTGDMYWQVGSLHLYERHFRYLE